MCIRLKIVRSKTCRYTLWADNYCICSSAKFEDFYQHYRNCKNYYAKLSIETTDISVNH